MISLEIFGNPVPQARPRFYRNKNHVGAFDPKSKEKEQCKWQIKSQFKESLLTMPLAVDVIFFMPIPKSSSKLKKRQMENGVLSHIKKPDIDNLQKFVLDCLNKIVFEDDSQIVEIRAKKIYSVEPRTLIRIIPLSEDKRSLLYENCSR